jgi:hypothetical protein
VIKTSPISIPLLRACRQIHAETSLLPYTLNTFAFKDTNDIDAFVSRPTQAQVRAIKVLGIHTVVGKCLRKGHDFANDRDEEWYTSFEPFRGLEKIEVEDKDFMERYDTLREQIFGNLAGNLRIIFADVAVTIWDMNLGPISAGKY